MDEFFHNLKLVAIHTCRLYKERIDRSRRLFIEERSFALKDNRHIEYLIKRDVSNFFHINYSCVAFTGSAQLGFSAHKDKPFVRRVSDLDIACIDVGLFQESWVDILETTRAFTDETSFSGIPAEKIACFKESIYKRGMIRVSQLPRSSKSLEWKKFEDKMSRDYVDFFKCVSIAIYMNEYAFCWKQDSALTMLTRE